eukprot:11727822-Ditylum_brightwellii.AAC.2
MDGRDFVTVSRMRRNSCISKRHGPRIKFELRTPKNHHETLECDRQLGNTLWKEATKVEMDKAYEYEAFKSLGKGGRNPNDHVMIQVHIVYDVKQDGR